MEAERRDWGREEEATFEVSIGRLVGISLEIMVGRAFQEKGTMFLGQSLWEMGTQWKFCRGDSWNEPTGFSHHLKVHTRAVVTTLGSQGDRGPVVWRAPTLKRDEFWHELSPQCFSTVCSGGDVATRKASLLFLNSFIYLHVHWAWRESLVMGWVSNDTYK